MVKSFIDACLHEFRMCIRQRMRPMSVEEAEEKRLFWAKMYALSSILLLVWVTQSIFRNQSRREKVEETLNMPVELRSAYMYTKDEPVRIIKFKGFSKVSDVTYSKEEVSQFLNKCKGVPSVNKDSENSKKE